MRRKRPSRKRSSVLAPSTAGGRNALNRLRSSTSSWPDTTVKFPRSLARAPSPPAVWNAFPLESMAWARDRY